MLKALFMIGSKLLPIAVEGALVFLTVPIAPAKSVFRSVEIMGSVDVGYL